MIQNIAKSRENKIVIIRTGKTTRRRMAARVVTVAKVKMMQVFETRDKLKNHTRVGHKRD